MAAFYPYVRDRGDARRGLMQLGSRLAGAGGRDMLGAMTRTSTSPAATEPTPTPSPASEQRTAAPRMRLSEVMHLIRERRDPKDAAALLEAGELYANDEDGAREIEDIQAGRHPLQHGGRNLDAWRKFETKLTSIRTRRGA